jgi:predicted RNA-binding Zn ribbon-like protein
MTDQVRTLKTLERVGGALCLDFANTINSRLQPEHDYLMKYSDLAQWAVNAGGLSTAQANRLQKQAEQDTQPAEKALQRARLLRELFYRLFSDIATGSAPKREDVRTFGECYADAIVHSTWARKGDRFVVDWTVDEALEAMLWPIVYSAGQLLSSQELSQVKACPGCGWLFLDTSKNQSRRWCSMNTCGARDKMRRYHRRLRSK